MMVEVNQAPLPTCRPTSMDRLALWLVKLSKVRRQELQQVEGDSYDKFYEAFFDEKDVDLYVKDPRSLTRHQTIVEYLQTHAPKEAVVLDVGCGMGDVLNALPHDYKLHGMDYAKHNVAVSTRRLKDRAIIKQGSIYEIPFEANTFDVCFCLEVLEHIEDDARGIRDIARVLKPGGVLLTAVPYTYYWPEYLKLMGHFRHYTRESFDASINANGLTVEDHLRNYPHWHQAYTRHYALIRAQHLLFGRFLGCKDLFDFRWPWRQETAMTRLAGKLEPLKQRDAALNYATLETSTFLVGRKRSGL